MQKEEKACAATARLVLSLQPCCCSPNVSQQLESDLLFARKLVLIGGALVRVWEGGLLETRMLVAWVRAALEDSCLFEGVKLLSRALQEKHPRNEPLQRWVELVLELVELRICREREEHGGGAGVSRDSDTDSDE